MCYCERFNQRQQCWVTGQLNSCWTHPYWPVNINCNYFTGDKWHSVNEHALTLAVPINCPQLQQQKFSHSASKMCKCWVESRHAALTYADLLSGRFNAADWSPSTWTSAWIHCVLHNDRCLCSHQISHRKIFGSGLVFPAASLLYSSANVLSVRLKLFLREALSLLAQVNVRSGAC